MNVLSTYVLCHIFQTLKFPIRGGFGGAVLQPYSPSGEMLAQSSLLTYSKSAVMEINDIYKVQYLIVVHSV